MPIRLSAASTSMNSSPRPAMRASSATWAENPSSHSGVAAATASSWAETVAASPRTTGPVSAARGPISKALATAASTSGRAASTGTGRR